MLIQLLQRPPLRYHYHPYSTFYGSSIMLSSSSKFRAMPSITKSSQRCPSQDPPGCPQAAGIPAASGPG